MQYLLRTSNSMKQRALVILNYQHYERAHTRNDIELQFTGTSTCDPRYTCTYAGTCYMDYGVDLG